MIDDFSGDNFRSQGPGIYQVVRTFGTIMTNGRPIEFHPTPPGTSRWAWRWKKAVARTQSHNCDYTAWHIAVMPGDYLDLDPTYKDAWGRPLLRMTFDFPKRHPHVAVTSRIRARQIARAMGVRPLSVTHEAPLHDHSLSKHTQRGRAVMGTDPKTSVVTVTYNAGTC